jgi:hypothetical protein
LEDVAFKAIRYEDDIGCAIVDAVRAAAADPVPDGGLGSGDDHRILASTITAMTLYDETGSNGPPHGDLVRAAGGTYTDGDYRSVYPAKFEGSGAFAALKAKWPQFLG